MGSDPKITLGVLTSIERVPTASQRLMARELGVALGLVNAYLTRCVHKGWVKMRAAPARRFAYYLTPEGFSEKSRLTAEYLSQSFNLFRQTRCQYEELIETCRIRGWTRLALAGVSEMTEIVILASAQSETPPAIIIDAGAAGGEVMGLPVVASLAEAGPLDAVLITQLRDPQGCFDELAGQMAPERLLAPRMLNVSRHRPLAEDVP